MAKKPVNDDNGEVTKTWGYILVNDESVAMPLVRLTLSDIVTQDTDGTITWRIGHLEHIANLYTGDPATTERDYADDLAVARAYSREQWEALIAPPQA